MSDPAKSLMTDFIAFEGEGLLRVGGAEPIPVIGMVVQADFSEEIETCGYWVKAMSGDGIGAKTAHHVAYVTDAEAAVALLIGMTRAASGTAFSSWQKTAVKGDFMAWSEDGFVEGAACEVRTIQPRTTGYGTNEPFRAILTAGDHVVSLEGKLANRLLRGALGPVLRSIREFDAEMADMAPAPSP